MDALIRRWLAAREPSETPASMRDAASVPYAEPRSWRPSLAPALSIAIGAAAVAVAALLGYQPRGARIGGPGPQPVNLPPPSGPAGNGLVAYESEGDIYVGDPTTGETTAIVAGPNRDMRPVFSPDGTARLLPPRADTWTTPSWSSARMVRASGRWSPPASATRKCGAPSGRPTVPPSW